jgi:DNA gyrase inhibitor GyrI
MAAVKIEQTRPMTIAYVEHTGEYGKLPFEEDMKTLCGWAKANKVRPGLQALGIFHGNPSETPPERCRSEVAIPSTPPGRRAAS